MNNIYEMPDFFIVGASKSGTTFFAEVLKNHPDICFSKIKEPNFFSSFDRNLISISSDQLLEYKKLFNPSNCKQLMGESSVNYLKSDNAIYWIKKYIPSAKIVIILRNPLERIVSLYEMYYRLGKMKIDFHEAFSKNSYLVKQCLLYESIKNYINTFSQKQVLIIIYDDFRKKPEYEFYNMCRFLGVREIYNPAVKARNKGGIPKSKALLWLKNRQLISIVKQILPDSLHTPLDNFIKYNFFAKIRLTSSQKKELINAFYSDVEMIGNLIDRNLCQEWLLINED